jgi:hypothetical protein
MGRGNIWGRNLTSQGYRLLPLAWEWQDLLCHLKVSTTLSCTYSLTSLLHVLLWETWYSSQTLPSSLTCFFWSHDTQVQDPVLRNRVFVQIHSYQVRRTEKSNHRQEPSRFNREEIVWEIVVRPVSRRQDGLSLECFKEDCICFGIVMFWLI